MEESDKREGGRPPSDPPSNPPVDPSSRSFEPTDPVPPPPQQAGQPADQDAGGRRRRGRRGRGGGFGGPRPQLGSGGPAVPRPPIGGQPFRRPQQLPREENEQTRDLAAYERRMQRQQGGQPGWRGGSGQGGPAGGWRPRRGQQRYAETVRRVTGSRAIAPSHVPMGEPIAGPHAILEAIRAGRGIQRLYVSQDRGTRVGPVNELITEAQARRIFVRYVDRMEIARMSPIENHQGVVAIVESKAGVELDELLLHLEALAEPALVLVLDSMQDPQNFGVLLRSAEAAGVDGVVIPHHRAVGLTAAVAKSSAGASEHLLVADVVNLRQAIDALKEKGIWVVGSDESGDLLYDEVDYRGPTAIVIGNEGEGIRRLVLEGCDQVVRIPMEGQVRSLNAAAAGTVLLYEALRQRRRNAPPAQTRTPRAVPVADDRDNPVAEPPPDEGDDAAAGARGEEDERVSGSEAKPAEKPARAKRAAPAKSAAPGDDAAPAKAQKPKRRPPTKKDDR